MGVSQHFMSVLSVAAPTLLISSAHGRTYIECNLLHSADHEGDLSYVGYIAGGVVAS